MNPKKQVDATLESSRHRDVTVLAAEARIVVSLQTIVAGTCDSFLEGGGNVMNVLRPVRDWLGVAVRDWPRVYQAFAEPVTTGVSPARGGGSHSAIGSNI